MDTKWLEDFVSLAQTRSFSQAAKLRHVTQPAFSRRIQALEAWAGTDLVDRSSYPTSLTDAGKTLRAQAIEMLDSLQSSRAMLRGYSGNGVIEFALPHALSLAFFPSWLGELQQHFPPLKTRLSALNVHDAVLRLVEGGCDFLIAYHHPALPLQLDSERFEMVVLGEEILAPFSKANEMGEPVFTLPAQPNKPTPYLSYSSGAYLGQVVQYLLKDSKTPIHLERVYETDMAEGLKAMALEGHGIAFLPESAVHKEVRNQKLAQINLPQDIPLEISIEIRAYREKPQQFRNTNKTADELWKFLCAKESLC